MAGTMDKLITTGLVGIVLMVQTVPAYTQPATFDPATFEATALTYATTATGGAAVAILPNPVIGESFEIRMPTRHEVSAGEQRDE
jgi:hypothetical protein